MLRVLVKIRGKSFSTQREVVNSVKWIQYWIWKIREELCEEFAPIIKHFSKNSLRNLPPLLSIFEKWIEEKIWTIRKEFC